MSDGFVKTLAVESWTLYFLGITLIGCRLISRRIKLQSWRLQIEDWLMAFVAVTFTCFTWSVNEVAINGSNYISPEDLAALTPQGREKAIYGSKMTLVLEIFTLVTIWTIKGCLLFLYHRLTLAFAKQQLAVKLIALYCFTGFSLVMGLYLGLWCQPIQQYWALPVQNSQCATYYHHMIFATAWNISSDLLLLAIPIPVIITSRLPAKRKVVLCAVLGLGILNIIIAILNRYYNFSNPNDLGYAYFYVAEVATAVYVGNIPLCWPLVRRVFQGNSWARSSAEGQKQDPNRPRTYTHGRNRRAVPSSIRSIIRGQTMWDKMNDSDDGGQLPTSTSRGSPGCWTDVEGQKSGGGGGGGLGSAGYGGAGGDGKGPDDFLQDDDTFELTPGFHRNANSTTVRADTESIMEHDLDHAVVGSGVNVVRTVEVSHTKS